jgi:hypothetical protein
MRHAHSSAEGVPSAPRCVVQHDVRYDVYCSSFLICTSRSMIDSTQNLLRPSLPSLPPASPQSPPQPPLLPAFGKPSGPYLYSLYKTRQQQSHPPSLTPAQLGVYFVSFFERVSLSGLLFYR